MIFRLNWKSSRRKTKQKSSKTIHLERIFIRIFSITLAHISCTSIISFLYSVFCFWMFCPWRVCFFFFLSILLLWLSVLPIVSILSCAFNCSSRFASRHFCSMDGIHFFEIRTNRCEPKDGATFFCCLLHLSYFYCFDAVSFQFGVLSIVCSYDENQLNECNCISNIWI